MHVPMFLECPVRPSDTMICVLWYEPLPTGTDIPLPCGFVFAPLPEQLGYLLPQSRLIVGQNVP
jgi:hypothetical protein